MGRANQDTCLMEFMRALKRTGAAEKFDPLVKVDFRNCWLFPSDSAWPCQVLWQGQAKPGGRSLKGRQALVRPGPQSPVCSASQGR
eukprot:14628128-Alexandrium_andersonii.AAC.1